MATESHTECIPLLLTQLFPMMECWFLRKLGEKCESFDLEEIRLFQVKRHKFKWSQKSLMSKVTCELEVGFESSHVTSTLVMHLFNVLLSITRIDRKIVCSITEIRWNN